nr:alternative NAD(P)H-ubiquinone oxidoreductase C1, chloroplastic/mitochondrial [Tanacetum cinerariifolium]
MQLHGMRIHKIFSAGLVLSLGAEPKLDIIRGAVEFALSFSTLDDALKVNDKLTKLERENLDKADLIRMVIVGLGYSRVELAATVSERLEGKGVVQAITQCYQLLLLEIKKLP